MLSCVMFQAHPYHPSWPGRYVEEVDVLQKLPVCCQHSNIISLIFEISNRLSVDFADVDAAVCRIPGPFLPPARICC